MKNAVYFEYMMMVRKTQLSDLDEVMEIYGYAREVMKRNGNPNQWCDDKPYREQIEEDISAGNSYVAENEGGICGVFAFIIGEDETYGYIEGGNWLNNEPYGTIHRIASGGKVNGILKTAVEFGFTMTDNVRVDTHRDNKIMQHLLTKLGFTECGIIYLPDGDPRIAYHKTK